MPAPSCSAKKARRIRVRRLPAWFPPALADAVRAALAALPEKEGARRSLRVKAEFSAGERKVLRYSRPMPVSQWAEKYRVLQNSAIPGRWKNSFTPYLAGIMDAANMPGVETVILCKSPQTGGSEAGHNLVAYCIDRLHGPVMYVFPDEVTARENAQERIIPMITASPRLAQYMTGLGDDASSLRIRLIHMTISLAWSGSVSRLGNKPVRVLILDELDKYANPRTETSSEALAEKRTTTWRSRRKIMKISTPTTESGPIWRAFTLEANARFDFFVRCPHCGTMQKMDADHLFWPNKDQEGEPSAEAVLAGHLAWYACDACGAAWTDADRDAAVREGEWRERETGMPMPEFVASKKPVKIGFHIPAFISYFVSLSEIARAALKAKESGEPNDMRDYCNQFLAEPWHETFEERDEADLLRHCDDRPRGAVPSPLPDSPDVPRVAALLAAVDTQKGYFRYAVRAYGFGQSQESWLVQCGALETFADLEQVLIGSEFFDGAGHSYRVSGIMIDAMGNRTPEVYAWAARHRGLVFPWQGVRRLSTPYDMTAIEYFPSVMGRKVRIPGGLTLWRCDVTFFKSALAQKLSIAPEDPGAFHLHSNEKKELDQYAKEMSAEIWDDESLAWINPQHRPNHFWDCEVMCGALAYIRAVHRIPLPGRERSAAPRPQPAASQPARRYWKL